MNICPILYKECGTARYSVQGLHKLHPALDELEDFPFSAEQQRQEAVVRASKISIQGVQPKLSVRLNRKHRQFAIVDFNGRFIVKPQHHIFPELPQNEDLTMRMAAAAGIETPLHGLIYCTDGSLSYFIRRFDRYGKNKKYALEDFAQLSGGTRDSKYDSSMEKVAGIVETYCSFPQVEKVKLFRLTLFSYLTGNEDMHLKNFSLISRDGQIKLSPGYDLLNTTIAMRNAVEQSALPVRGRKNNLSATDLVEYYGRERLGLNERTASSVVQEFSRSIPEWYRLLEISFLSDGMKEQYRGVLGERARTLGL